MSVVLRSLFCGLLLGAIASPAFAVPLVYTLDGTIGFIDPDLAAESPPFALGDPFHFTFSLDSATPGSPVGGGLQYNMVDSFAITLNSIYGVEAIFPNPPAGNIIVVDGSPRDQFQTNLQALPGAPFPPDLGIFRMMQVVTTLHDDAGATFSSDALPTSLDPSDWTYINNVQMIFRDPNNLVDQRSVFGAVTFASVAVPEPGLAALLAVGFTAAFARHGWCLRERDDGPSA
jgi:hypothetical protein